MQSVMDAVLSVGTAGMRRTAKQHNDLLSSLPVWQADMQQRTTSSVLYFFLGIFMSGL